MGRTNAEIEKRRRNVINLWARGYDAETIKKTLDAQGIKSSLATIYRDINRKIDLSDEEAKEYGRKLKYILQEKLKVLEEEMWDSMGKDMAPNHKVGVAKVINEILKEIREIAQTTGIMEKSAQKIDINADYDECARAMRDYLQDNKKDAGKE